MNITPESAFSWVVIYSLIVAVTLGGIAFSGPLYKYFKDAFKGIGLAVMFLGVVMVSSPKWTEIVVKFKGFEGKIASLKSQNQLANTQIVLLKKEKAEQGDVFAKKLADLSSRPSYKSAADATVLAAVADVSVDELKAYKSISEKDVQVALLAGCDQKENPGERIMLINCGVVNPVDIEIVSRTLVEALSEKGIFLYRPQPMSIRGAGHLDASDWFVGAHSREWGNVIEAITAGEANQLK